MYSGSRVNGKGKEKPAASGQKRTRNAQDASASTHAMKKKRVQFSEGVKDSGIDPPSASRAPQQQLLSNGRATDHSRSHGKEPIPSINAPDQADQRSDGLTAKSSKRFRSAHDPVTAAKATANTSSTANDKVPNLSDEHQSDCAHAQDPAGEGNQTAQQPNNAAYTHAARQTSSSIADAQDTVGVSLHTAHKASMAASTRAATNKSSSTAHAKDPAGEGLQTASHKLPAVRSKAAARVPDTTGSSQAQQKEPIAARTRSAHRAVTETARQGKRKEPAAVTVDPEEQCRGAKRARAGSASSYTPAEGNTVRQPRKVISKKETGRLLKNQRRQQPARAVSDVTKECTARSCKTQC